MTYSLVKNDSSSPLKGLETAKTEVELKFMVKDGSTTQELLLNIAKLVSADVLARKGRHENPEDSIQDSHSADIMTKLREVLGDAIAKDIDESDIEVEYKTRDSYYYDTKKLDLYKAGCSLRTRRRRKGDYRIHVKTNDENNGKGLFRRQEYRLSVSPSDFQYYEKYCFFPFVDEYFSSFLGNKNEITVDKFPLSQTIFIRKYSTRIKLKRADSSEEYDYCILIDRFRFQYFQSDRIQGRADKEFLEMEIEVNSEENQEKLREIAKHLEGNSDIEFSKSSKYGFAIEKLGLQNKLSFSLWRYVNEHKSDIAILGTITIILNNMTHFVELSINFLIRFLN